MSRQIQKSLIENDLQMHMCLSLLPCLCRYEDTGDSAPRYSAYVRQCPPAVLFCVLYIRHCWGAALGWSSKEQVFPRQKRERVSAFIFRSLLCPRLSRSAPDFRCDPKRQSALAISNGISIADSPVNWTSHPCVKSVLWNSPWAMTMRIPLIYTNTNVLQARAGFDVMEQISTLCMFFQLYVSPKADSELLNFTVWSLRSCWGEFVTNLSLSLTRYSVRWLQNYCVKASHCVFYSQIVTNLLFFLSIANYCHMIYLHLSILVCPLVFLIYVMSD